MNDALDIVNVLLYAALLATAWISGGARRPTDPQHRYRWWWRALFFGSLAGWVFWNASRLA